MTCIDAVRRHVRKRNDIASIMNCHDPNYLAVNGMRFLTCCGGILNVMFTSVSGVRTQGYVNLSPWLVLTCYPATLPCVKCLQFPRLTPRCAQRARSEHVGSVTDQGNIYTK